MSATPRKTKKLYEKVLERGAILSKFLLGTHPAPENVPIRNRIVDAAGSNYYRRCAILGPVDHGAVGVAIWQGSIWSAGECDASGELRAEFLIKQGQSW
jgi:hypothetical protein